MLADREAMVIDALLTCSRLMAVEAGDVLLCMRRKLVIVDHRILEPGMAFGALARSTNKVCRGLLCFNFRSRKVNKKSGDYQRKCDCDSNKDLTKRHELVPPGELGERVVRPAVTARGSNH